MAGKHERELSRGLEEFGKKVKARRTALGLRQSDFSVDEARGLPIDMRELQRIEYGKVNLTFKTLYKLCIHLKIDAKELFDFEWPKKS